MKLQEVYKQILDEFKAISLDCELLEKLKNHIQAVKEAHEYKKYDCNNDHINTLALRCLRDSKLDELL